MTDNARTYGGTSNIRRRVKLYMLNEERQWDDRGTGHVSVSYVDRLKGESLVVKSETDGSLLLESKIQTDTGYQKQQDTLIVWSEADSLDLALSFQEKEGCDNVWEEICRIQGRDPSVEGGQDDDDVLDESAEVTNNSPQIELPPCTLAQLEELHDCIAACMTNPSDKEALALQLESHDYVSKLLELFRKCEDLENVEALRLLFDIFRNIFLLNRNDLYQQMLSEQNIMDVIGVLEYDANSIANAPQPIVLPLQKHRSYIRTQANFKEVIPIANVDLLSKIHQTFRLQYIQDFVFPAQTVFEENMLSALSAMIFFNKVDIVTMVQQDDQFLCTLFRLLVDPTTADNRRLDLLQFLKEFCNFSSTLQPQSKEQFLKALAKHGILSALETLLATDQEQLRPVAVDILSYLIEFSPSMVRSHILAERKVDDEEDLLINLVIEQLINDKDAELSGSMQLCNLLKLMLDPESMVATGTVLEKSEFLQFFYKTCMHQLTAPLFCVTCDSVPSRDDYRTALLLNQILELLTFCVEQHTHCIKHYIINKDLLRRVLVLLQSRHKFLALTALRFLRRLIGKKDDAYQRYIRKNDLFRPVIDAFLANGSRYNLLNSAFIELFEFIRQDEIKPLLIYLMESYGDKLQDIKYIGTFYELRLKYDQHLDRQQPVNRTLSTGGVMSPMAAASANMSSPGNGPTTPRPLTYARRILEDEDEDDWIERGDEETQLRAAAVADLDGLSASAVNVGTGMASAEREQLYDRMHKMWTNKRAMMSNDPDEADLQLRPLPTVKSQPASGMIQINLKSTSPPPSTVNLHSPTSPVQTSTTPIAIKSVPTSTFKGLVDYDDDDEESDETSNGRSDEGAAAQLSMEKSSNVRQSEIDAAESASVTTTSPIESGRSCSPPSLLGSDDAALAQPDSTADSCNQDELPMKVARTAAQGGESEALTDPSQAGAAAAASHSTPLSVAASTVALDQRKRPRWDSNT